MIPVEFKDDNASIRAGRMLSTREILLRLFRLLMKKQRILLIPVAGFEAISPAAGSFADCNGSQWRTLEMIVGKSFTEIKEFSSLFEMLFASDSW